ncbi:transposase, IS4 family protein, partial [mine drainage metagenome]
NQRKSPRDNPHGGQKIDFAPHAAERFKTRTQVERVNARLKDEFGARWLRVRGPAKVTAHLMLAVLALTADQLLRLVTWPLAAVARGLDGPAARACACPSVAR